MQACPFGPEWNTLVKSVGEFQAYRDYLEQQGEIRTPEQVNAKLAEQGVLTSMYSRPQYQLERTPNTLSEATVDVFTNLAETLIAKFPEGYAYKLVSLPNENWKGMVETATGPLAVEGKPTIVINTAKASLDTPIHEFGHIFFNMLKKDNIRLYFKLMNGLFNNKLGDVTTTDADGNTVTKREIIGYEVKEPLRSEFEIIKRLYPRTANETNEQAELRQAEELVVELMGRAGAEFYDKETGLFKQEYVSNDTLLNMFAKALNKIWEAIKDILFRGDVTIAVNAISSDTRIEDLAAMLAAPNVKFTTGHPSQSVEESLKRQLTKNMVRLKTLKDELATRPTLTKVHIDEYSYFLTPNQQAELDTFKIKAPIIRKYVDPSTSQNEEKFINGLRHLSKALRTEKNTLGRDLTNDEAIAVLDRNEYRRVKFLINGMSYDSLESMLLRLSTNDTWDRDRAVEKIQQEICDLFWDSPYGSRNTSYSEGDLIKDYITGSRVPLNAIFGQTKPVYKVYDRINRDTGTTALTEALKDINDKIVSLNKAIQNPGIRFKKNRKSSFQIKLARPTTGEEITDTITVSSSINSTDKNQIDISFSSDIWGYQDSYWVVPATVSNTKFAKKVRKIADIDPNRRGTRTQEVHDSRDVYGVMSVTDTSAEILALNDSSQGELWRKYYNAKSRLENNGVGLDRYETRRNYSDEQRETDEETVDTITRLIQVVPLSQLDVEIDQKGRAMQVMSNVMDELSNVWSDLDYTKFHFSAASGQSLERGTGEERLKLYNSSAKRVFGKYTVAANNVDGTTILVPSSFRSNVDLEQRVYQKDRTPDTMSAFTKEHDSMLSDVGLDYIRESLNVDPVTTDNSSAVGAIKSFARSLANQLKVGEADMKFAFINGNEAAQITKDTQNPWNGQKAFFVGDTIYFVGDDLSLSDVFHEFSHPFVRTLSTQNRELFDKLYGQAISTQEGQYIYEQVIKAYPHLSEKDDLFKEEIIVRALTAAADMDKAGVQQTKDFSNVISRIFDALKKLLRKMFGNNISVSKLNPNSTVREIANMLKEGDSFILDESVLNNIDTVAYIDDINDYTTDLKKVEKSDLLEIIMKGHDIAIKHIDILMRNKNYKEIASVMVDEFNHGDLQAIRNDLSKYARPLLESATKKRDAIQYEKNQLEATVSSLLRLQVMVGKITKHMIELSEQPDNIDNMHKAYYYNYLFEKGWEPYIADVIKALNEVNIESNTPLSNLATSIQRSIGQSKKYIKKMFAKGAQDILYAELRPMGEKVAERYSNIIESLKKNNAHPDVIDKWTVEYYGLTQKELERKNDLIKAKENNTITTSGIKELEGLVHKSMEGAQITDEKIKLALNGELDDANVFSSFFEGYMYNSDPVVGGFALYVKNQMSDVMNIAQGKFNSYAVDMQPLLEAANYNATNVNELINKVGHVQYVGKRNEKGEWEEVPVWTLRSMHKDWRIHLDRARRDIDDAEKNHSKYATEATERELMNAVAAKKKLMTDYFYQEYQQEVYERDKLLQNDAVGIEAGYRKDRIFDQMSELSNPLLTQMDELKTAHQMERLWREYHQLFSIVDLNGNLKPVDSMDYKVAVRLKEHRSAAIDPKTGESYFDWKPRTGVYENAFAKYEQELVTSGIDKNPVAYAKAINEWLDSNLRIVIKPEFYQQRKVIMDSINTIMDKLPDADRKKVSITEQWTKILDLTAGNRDDDGQPNGSSFTKDGIAFIKNQQELINKAMEEFAGLSGLTKAEGVIYQGLWDIITAKERKLTDDEQQRFDILMDKSDRLGLDKTYKTILFGLFARLQGLQKKIATDYYVDSMNNWLSKLSTADMIAKMRVNNITKDTANFLIEDRVINGLLEQDTPEGKEFAEWFNANHIRKTVYDKEAGGQKEVWERIYAWNVVRPVEDNFYETSTIAGLSPATVEAMRSANRLITVKKSDGTDEERVKGLPSMKYYARVIKPQYRTERIVGVTVDNQGNFLPRNDVPGSPFIDTDYMNMATADPAHYAILEKMKEHHLRNQEGLGYKSRLYLDIPRYRKNNLEVLRTKQIKQIMKSAASGSVPILQIIIERMKDFFRRSKDAMEGEGALNAQDDFTLVRADMFDNEVTNVPISGLYNLNIDDVSTDVNNSLMRYMFSAERQKKLIEINPVAQALRATVNDPDNMAKQLDKINKYNFIHRGLVTYVNKKGKYTRQVAVNNFIEREFEGKTEAGMTADMPWLQNTANMIFKKAAFSYFALNIPSAIKNALGAKFQGMIEAVGGENVDFTSMAKGEVYAFNTMAQVSSTLYTHGPKPLNIQLAYSFDVIRDSAEKKMSESMSRSFAQDVASLTWMTNFRKWVEDEATMQLFGGMMYKQKIKKADGTEIAYMDAWENPDNKLKLKDGIDVRWSNLPVKHTVVAGDTLASLAKKYHMTEDDLAKEIKKVELKEGKEFTINNGMYKAFRTRFHSVQMDLNGAYDKFDQPEAQRYLAFRMISFLKRYFTTGLVKRWGFSGNFTGAKRGRINPGLGDIQEGYYTTTLKTMYRVATMGMKYLPHLQKQEKIAMLKTLIEVLSVMSLLMIVAPLLGWDPKDPERFEKLRKRSGDLPFFGLVPEDPEHPFQAGGWMMNHLLKMTLDVRSEAETFIPWAGYGLDNYYSTFTDMTSLGYGPTLKTYKQMIEQLYMEATGNPYAKYQKDSGPYEWQKEEGSKFITTFMKGIGFTGSTVSPVLSIKNTTGSGGGGATRR